MLVLLLVSGSLCQETPLSRSIDALSRRGVEFSLDSTTDLFLVTGLHHRNGTGETWLDLSGDVQLAHFRRSLSRTHAFFSLHVNGNWNSGLGGAAQSISGIQSRAGIRFAELWVEQTLTSALRLRVGKIDGNRDFAYIENASSFVNSAGGYNPSFSLLPNYNATQPGIELLMRAERIRLNLATFTKEKGTGLLMIEEGEGRWRTRNHPGRLALGAWQSSGTTVTLDDNLHRGACGVYVVVEQNLWHAEQGLRALTTYVQWGTAPAKFSTFARHSGGGVIWKAPVPSHQNDAVGFSVARGAFSTFAIRSSPDRETVWETFYRAQISSRITISPDFQYVAQPGGLKQNVFAFGARMIVNLVRQDN